MLLLSAAAASAEDSIDSYCATMGEQDHFASDGYPLKDAAQIIRQDRANYHAFHNRDSDDDSDGTFGSKASRARIEQMVRRGGMGREVRSEIVNGNPYICVDVYSNSIEVLIQ